MQHIRRDQHGKPILQTSTLLWKLSEKFEKYQIFSDWFSIQQKDNHLENVIMFITIFINKILIIIEKYNWKLSIHFRISNAFLFLFDSNNNYFHYINTFNNGVYCSKIGLKKKKKDVKLIILIILLIIFFWFQKK